MNYDAIIRELTELSFNRQTNRSCEHEERLRELCMLQQEINKLLDLDKGDAQAVANDTMPQDEQAVGAFVERLATRRSGHV